TMRGNQLGNNGQTQSATSVTPGAVGIQTDEPLEDPTSFRRCDARAVVAHRDRGNPVAATGFDLDARFGVADSVIHQVTDDPRQRRRVAGQLRRRYVLL